MSVDHFLARVPLTNREIRIRIRTIRRAFPKCPVCEKAFDYSKEPELSASNGPHGAIEVILTGYYGSSHDEGQRRVFVCDDCADILLGILGVNDLGKAKPVKSRRTLKSRLKRALVNRR